MRDISTIIRRQDRSNQKGITMIETVVTLAILRFFAVVILSALATSAKATMIAKEQATAESLARHETEYIKQSPFVPDAVSYPVDTSLIPDPARTKEEGKMTASVWIISGNTYLRSLGITP